MANRYLQYFFISNEFLDEIRLIQYDSYVYDRLKIFEYYIILIFKYFLKTI